MSDWTSSPPPPTHTKKNVSLFEDAVMPIPVECDYCGARYQVPDQAAGRTIKCKACAERISVGGAAAGVLPPRASGGGKKRPAQQKSQSSNTGLIVGGIVGIVVLVAVVIGVMMMGGGDDPQSVAGNDPGGNAGAGANASGNPGGGEGTGGNTAPGSGFQKPSTTAESPQQPDVTFSQSSGWSVSADRPVTEFKVNLSKPFTKPLENSNLRGAGVIFPVVPSPLVAVLQNAGSKYSYTVYDIAADLKLAEVPAPSGIAATALSDDGSYLAVSYVSGTRIDVWDIKGEKSLGTLEGGAAGKTTPSHLALLESDQLVGISTFGHFIKIWELPSGDVVREIKIPEKCRPAKGFAFSPGGRYLALVADYLTKQIDIFDLETGKTAGSIVVEGKLTTFDIGALGFSGDGTQFGVMYEMHEASRLIVWDLVSGQRASDFEIKPKLKEQLDPVYQSATLESFPGNQYWLVHSLGIIDTSVQQLVYTLPKQESISLFPSRKVLSADGVLSVSTAGGDPHLETIAISNEQLLAGADTAAAGGFASDIGLPPLTTSDFLQAKTVEAVNEWTYQPQPLETEPIQEKINFHCEGTLRDIVLSRNQMPMVAVRSGINEDMKDPALSAYERLKEMSADKGYDYKVVEPVGTESEILAFQSDGTRSAQFKIPFSAKLRGVSPDGTQAVFEEHRTNGRLDVFEVSDEGRHVIAWRPFRSAEKKEHREIKSAEFIDDDHIATLSMNYVLVVWNIRNLKPVWKLDEVLQFTVAPKGSRLIVLRGNILGSKAVAVFDGLSGSGLGSMELEGPTKSIALHHKGQLFALSQISGPNNVLRIVNLESGTLLEEFPVPSTGASLAWAGDDYLLLDGTQLISRPLQSVVWNYEADDVRFPECQVTPDLCVARQFTGKRAGIRLLSLPSSRVTSRLDPAQLKQQAILSPGDPVSLNVTVANKPLLLPLQDKASELFTTSLEQSQKTVAGNSGVTVTAKVSLDSQGSAEVSKLGSRSEKVTVNRQAVKIDIAYQQRGKTIWSTTRNVGNLDKIVQRIQQGESVQQSIDRQMVESAEGLISTLKLPTYIFGDDAKRGLGTSKLIE